MLVENSRNKKRFAVKKIICHSLEDQKIALAEVNYYKMLDHPNILRCLDSAVEGVPDPVLNSTSEVLLLLPYYPVGCINFGVLFHCNSDNLLSVTYKIVFQ